MPLYSIIGFICLGILISIYLAQLIINIVLVKKQRKLIELQKIRIDTQATSLKQYHILLDKGTVFGGLPNHEVEKVVDYNWKDEMESFEEICEVQIQSQDDLDKWILFCENEESMGNPVPKGHIFYSLMRIQQAIAKRPQIPETKWIEMQHRNPKAN